MATESTRLIQKYKQFKDFERWQATVDESNNVEGSSSRGADPVHKVRFADEETAIEVDPVTLRRQIEDLERELRNSRQPSRDWSEFRRVTIRIVAALVLGSVVGFVSLLLFETQGWRAVLLSQLVFLALLAQDEVGQLE